MRSRVAWGLAALLAGAPLAGVDLVAADLRGARGLDRAKLSGAHYDAHTRWPSGFNPARHRAVRVE